jgi:hypothetical protein
MTAMVVPAQQMADKSGREGKWSQLVVIHMMGGAKPQPPQSF